jgi:hypothetical protein
MRSFTASPHFLTYLWLDRLFDFQDLAKDIAKRPFITAGFAAFVLLLPLAVTSTRGWIRRLGGRRWRALHRLLYAAAIAAVVHYYWLVKSDDGCRRRRNRQIRLPRAAGCVITARPGLRSARPCDRTLRPPERPAARCQ